MTATLGVGKARGDDEAVLFVLKKCANMDASEIAVVRNNTEELGRWTNDPVESTTLRIITAIHQIDYDPNAKCKYGNGFFFQKLKL